MTASEDMIWPGGSRSKNPSIKFWESHGNLLPFVESQPGQNLISLLVEAKERATEPETILSEFSIAFKDVVCTDSDELEDWTTLVGSCVLFLERDTTLETWDYVQRLSWYSSALETYLLYAVSERGECNEIFAKRLLVIAEQATRRAIEHPGRQEAEWQRERGGIKERGEAWTEHPLLSLIWSGLNDYREFFRYRDDGHLLEVIALLEPKAFIQFLDWFPSPYPIWAILLRHGLLNDISRWKYFTATASVAFEETGSWNGSMVLPLLLSWAHQKIMDVDSSKMDDEQTNLINIEIERSSRAVVETLLSRQDGKPAAERWATWLMRELMRSLSSGNLSFPAQLRGRGHSLSMLIDRIFEARNGKPWSIDCPPDAEDWEAWIYRAVLVTAALKDPSILPNTDSFVKDWSIGIDEWQSSKVPNLLKKYSLFKLFNSRPDSYGTRLLALSLITTRSAEEVWVEMWQSAHSAREIIEFGAANPNDSSYWEQKRNASDSIQLLFGIGLMMLDHITWGADDLQKASKGDIIVLIGLLANAVNELRSIDIVDPNYWQEASRHLVVRYALWSLGNQRAVSLYNTVSPAEVGNFILKMCKENEDTISMVEVLLRNGFPAESLRVVLKEAGINLGKEFDMAEKIESLNHARQGRPYKISDLKMKLGFNLHSDR